MTSNEFSNYADKLLALLEDNPGLPQQPGQPNRTTFPGINEIDGELMPIPLPEDESTAPARINAPVSEEDSMAARGAYPMVGLDVLAFYKSFRFKKLSPFPGEWGVFLFDAGVAGLTADLLDLSAGLTVDELRQIAVELLLAHERYHFWIDAWALGQEITPLAKKFKRYMPYLAGKRQVELTLDDREESLANHYAFQSLRRRTLSDGTTAAHILRKVLGAAPAPYSSFAFDKVERAKMEGKLALTVANGLNPHDALLMAQLGDLFDQSILSASIKPVVKSHPVAGTASCPVYQVRTSNYAQLVQPFQGPDLSELRRFVTAYLNGKPLEHTDHSYYKIDNGEKLKLPNAHDKNARGYELKGTLHKAGMTHKEFQQERQRTNKWKDKCPRSEMKPPRAAQ